MTIVDYNNRLFIARFWVAYWQGRVLMLEGFPPDGENRNDAPVR